MSRGYIEKTERKSLLFLFFMIYFFYYILISCMHECYVNQVHAVPVKARRGHQIPWHWSASCGPLYEC